MKSKVKINFEEFFDDVIFSAYDFVVLFIALNLKEGKLEFSKDKLIDYIIYCKENDKYLDLFQEISLDNLWQINEVMSRLEEIKILLPTEKEGIMLITEGNYYEELIKPREEFVLEMTNFIHDYNNELVLKKN